MTTEELNNLRSNILKGIEVSFKKLVAEREKSGEKLIVSKNGKIMTINASKFKEK